MRQGLVCLNLDEQSLGEDGLVVKSLKSSNENNHHYDRKAYIQLLSRNLDEIVQS